MKKFLFLSSALIMTVYSAFAEDVATTDKKITGGAGTCTVDVLGVSADGATANTIATWSLNSYECAAGQYLDETTLNCTECPTGSYCPGGTFTVEANNSKTACPADYTSDAAATAESECYMGCELACGTNAECPAHSKNCVHSAFTTTGRQYVDATCNAYPSVCPVADFGCDMGYNKNKLSIQDVHNISQEIGGMDLLLLCSFDNQDAHSSNNINDCDFIKPGQLLAGDIIFELSNNAYDENTIGIKHGAEFEYTNDVNMTYTESISYLPNANFQQTDTGNFAWVRISKMFVPNYDHKMAFKAISAYSSEGAIPTEIMSQLEPETRAFVQDLFNKIESGASESELLPEIVKLMFIHQSFVEATSPWIYIGERKIFDVSDIGLSFPFLIQPIDYLFQGMDTLQDVVHVNVCTANTININWNPDNGGEHTQNMCMYDGSIILPTPDPVKPGYTFTGWKLVEPTTTTE